MMLGRPINHLISKPSYNEPSYGEVPEYFISGPSCSKLTMSLVNDSLKFISGHTQIC